MRPIDIEKNQERLDKIEPKFRRAIIDCVLGNTALDLIDEAESNSHMNHKEASQAVADWYTGTPMHQRVARSLLKKVNRKQIKENGAVYHAFLSAWWTIPESKKFEGIDWSRPENDLESVWKDLGII